MASPMAGAYSLPQGFYEELAARARDQVEQIAAQIASEGIEATGIALSEPASFAIVEQAKAYPLQQDGILPSVAGNLAFENIGDIEDKMNGASFSSRRTGSSSARRCAACGESSLRRCRTSFAGERSAKGTPTRVEQLGTSTSSRF